MSEKDRIKIKRQKEKRKNSLNEEIEIINGKIYIAKNKIWQNGILSAVIPGIIFMFLFLPSKGGRIPPYTIDMDEGLLIFFVLLSIPIVTMLITSIWSLFKIKKYKKQINNDKDKNGKKRIIII